jgi:tail tube protein
MAETAAITGKGTTISYATTSGGSYTPLSEVTDVGIPESTVGTVDATHYLSPDNQTEYISSIWQDGSDLAVTLNYVKAQTTILHGLKGDRLYWKITLPDASTYIFPGVFTRLGGATPNKDKITQTMTIKVAGAITYLAGA